MLLLKTEIEEMKSKYSGCLGEQQSVFCSAISPNEKFVAFNFMQAREDFMRLAEAYNELLDGLGSSAKEKAPGQSENKKFIVLIDSNYVRDAQILPANHYANEEDENGNPIDNSSAWEDFEAELLIGIFTTCCEESAIYEASQENEIDAFKLVAYQIVD